MTSLPPEGTQTGEGERCGTCGHPKAGHKSETVLVALGPRLGRVVSDVTWCGCCDCEQFVPESRVS